jgi:hypothetical protein
LYLRFGRGTAAFEDEADEEASLIAKGQPT